MAQRIRSVIIMLLFAAPPLLNASWERANGPFGGNAACFAVKGLTVFVGGFTNGVFRSTVDGNGWTRASGNLSGFHVNALVCMGNDLFSATDVGVCRSSDNGATWSLVGRNFSNPMVRSLAVCDGYLFAGTSNGLYRSVNNGDVWLRLPTAGMDTMFNCIAAVGNLLFIKNGSETYRSADYGNTWSNVKLTSSDRHVAVVSIDSLMFAGNWSGVFRSVDSGKTWTMMTTGVVYDLVVCNKNLFAAQYGVSVVRSSDNGVTWTNAAAGLPDRRISALAVQGDNLYIGCSCGIFKSTDAGNSWKENDSGFIATDVVSVAAFGPYLFAATNDNGLFRSADDGASWALVDSAFRFVAMSQVSVCGNMLFAQIYRKALYRSLDSGMTWEKTTDTFDSYRIVKKDSLLFACSLDDGVFRSADSGKTWQGVNNGIKSKNMLSLNVFGTSVFAGTYSNGIFRTFNNGESWTQYTTFTNNATDLASNGSQLFISSGGVWRADSIDNVIPIWANLEDFSHNGIGYNSMAIDATDLYASVGSARVFHCPIHGDTLMEASAGLADVWIISSLAISKTDLLAGSTSGVLKRSLSDFSYVGVRGGWHPLWSNALVMVKPAHGGGVRIEFTIASANRVIMRFYDPSGRQTAVITDRTYERGSHSIVWNGMKTGAGCRVLETIVGSQRMAQSVLLLR